MKHASSTCMVICKLYTLVFTVLAEQIWDFALVRFYKKFLPSKTMWLTCTDLNIPFLQIDLNRLGPLDDQSGTLPNWDTVLPMKGNVDFEFYLGSSQASFHGPVISFISWTRLRWQSYFKLPSTLQHFWWTDSRGKFNNVMKALMKVLVVMMSGFTHYEYRWIPEQRAIVELASDIFVILSKQILLVSRFYWKRKG